MPSSPTCDNGRRDEEERLLDEEPTAESQRDNSEYLNNLKEQLGIDTIQTAIQSLTSALAKSNDKRSSQRHEAGPARKRSRTANGEGFDPTEPLDTSSNSEINSESDGEEDDLPPSIFNANESKGPEVSAALAKRVNEAFTVKPLEGKMKSLMEKYQTPSNCEYMCVPRVNSTLWNELAKKAHHTDLGLQEAQKAIVKTGQIIVQITDEMLKAKKNKEQIKPSKYIGPLSDAINFLGHAGYQTSLKRRELLKPELSKNFQSLCSATVPITSQLFGDDLSKFVDDIAKANKVATRITQSTEPRRGRNRGFSRRPRNSSGYNNYDYNSGGNFLRQRAPSTWSRGQQRDSQPKYNRNRSASKSQFNRDK